MDGLLDEIEEIEIPGTKMKSGGQCFADDTMILGDSLEDLKMNIRIVEKWTDKNCMKVNVEKCGIMRFLKKLC